MPSNRKTRIRVRAHHGEYTGALARCAAHANICLPARTQLPAGAEEAARAHPTEAMDDDAAQEVKGDHDLVDACGADEEGEGDDDSDEVRPSPDVDVGVDADNGVETSAAPTQLHTHMQLHTQLYTHNRTQTTDHPPIGECQS